MKLDTPLATFLDDLRSEQRPGAEEALAVAGASAAALIAQAAHTTGTAEESVSTQAESLLAELRKILERLQDPASSKAGTLDDVMALGRHSAAILDLAASALGRLRSRSPVTIPALAAAVALSRAAAVGALQQVTLHLNEVPDALSRVTLKSQAEGVAQRARQAEADFMRAVLVEGTTR